MGDALLTFCCLLYIFHIHKADSGSVGVLRSSNDRDSARPRSRCGTAFSLTRRSQGSTTPSFPRSVQRTEATSVTNVGVRLDDGPSFAGPVYHHLSCVYVDSRKLDAQSPRTWKHCPCNDFETDLVRRRSTLSRCSFLSGWSLPLVMRLTHSKFNTSPSLW